MTFGRLSGLPVAGLVLALIASCSPGPATDSSIEPAATSALFDGTSKYVGVNIDWANDNGEAYARRTGWTPDVLVDFFRVPLQGDDQQRLERLLSEASRHDAIALVTLEPTMGLDAVTNDALTHFAAIARPAASAGLPVLVRFGHEMNGSWYPWSQQPTAYRDAFVRVAAAVHSLPGAATLWAPNYGGGYPFTGGRYAAQPGSADHSTLDTDRDGDVDGDDDPYASYYPGDESVDWVGMSLYHWGSAYPWGENEAPESGKFAAQLTGTYAGLAGDETAVPDFYAEYAVRRGKLVAIPETAAFYRPGFPGASEQEVKAAWFRQVFSSDPKAFPKLRMINWFEWRKPESEVGDQIVDWRATGGDPALLTEFSTAAERWRGVR